MSSKLVVQVEPERLELRLRGVSALAAGTVYAPVVLEGAGGAVAPVLRLFRDETCADAVAWTSEPASPVPHHSRLMSFPELRLDVQAALDWFTDACDAKSLPSSGRVWGWLVAVDMGNGSDVGPVVLGASRVPVLLHDFSPVETDPGESWSSVLAGLVADAIASTLGDRVSALEANTYSKSDVDGIVAALETGSRQIVASLASVVSPQPLVIYMVAKSAAQTSNVYDEFIWIEVDGVGRWEKIGDTEIDLSGYVQKEAGKGLFSGAYADLTGKPTLEDAVTRTSSNAVKSSGIWSAIWGTLAALPSGFSALYDWVVNQLAGKLSTRGGTMTGELVMNRGNAVVFGEASGPAIYTRNGMTLEADTRGTTGVVALLSDIPAVPTASTDTPLADGTASAGTSAAYARGNHRHPTDTSRQASITASGILKGDGSGGVTAAVVGTDYQAPLSAAQLADIAAVPGKADAADLRYRIAEAAVRKTLPADCFPVTFTYDGVSYSVNSLVKESEASAAGDMYINVNENYYSLTVVESPATGSEPMSVIGAAMFNEGGVFSIGTQDLQFGGVSPVEGTSPTLADIQVLADRTVNLITATDETSIDIELPDAQEGYSRDFYLAVTCGATAPTLNAPSGVTLVNAKGEPPDLSLTSSATTVLRFTEVKEAGQSDPAVFCVTGGANGGGGSAYPMVAVTPSSGTLTVTPYTVATYTAGDSAAAFTVAVGTGETGKARDCELVIDCTATGAVAPTVTWPATFHPRTDADDFACEAGVRNVYYISEYATGEFVVGGWQETAGGNA